MVLATDMSYHFTQLKTIKNMISLNETIDKPKALSLLLHCADISHPGKKWSLHERWTNLLMDEFFAQVINKPFRVTHARLDNFSNSCSWHFKGDKEKELGLPFSPLCDRINTPIAQSQIGFINFIVEPSMSVLGDMIDRIFDQILSEEQSRTSKSDVNDSSSSNDSVYEILIRFFTCHVTLKY
jgi:calcium/calmodulin-dependent 3',5'-cyclic nucleotide phosphodiesterase